MAQKLIAYCLKTKQKEEMLEAKISKTKRGGYIAKGVTSEGHKVSLIMSEVNAMKAIDEGIAKKDF